MLPWKVTPQSAAVGNCKKGGRERKGVGKEFFFRWLRVLLLKNCWGGQRKMFCSNFRNL